MQMSTADGMTHKRVTRAITVMAVISVLIMIVFIISMDTGPIRMAPGEVIRTVFGEGTAKDQLTLFDFRLPRIVITILIGAGLAVSGCILQAVTHNPLSDPGILGINSGAGLVVILYTLFFPNVQSTFALPFLAFFGALLTAVLIYVLAAKRREGLSPTRVVLVGIAIAAAINAAMMVLEMLLDPQNFQFVATWLAGSIVGTDWTYVLALLPWIIVLLAFTLYKSRVLNVLSLGDQLATSLGAPVEREKRLLLGVAVALAGASVAVGGAISFVGLVGPHLARRLVGTKYEFLVPASALTGALLVILADMLAKWVLQPTEIPTGIVVAVIGAPYFLYLLVRWK
ncbi:FecCD family ABC transporter permease [Alicyclobacillus suci]|uniref:FecCD family ABC transporter permease n=1 Tax=Alicyclobacillus suci TaxID=2816080 RepID=UPI001A8F3DB4|nr:iron ABC transporter permease [Alicyclobacillus suci]